MRFVHPHVHERDAALVELARVDPKAGERALVVVFPRTACSAMASAVVVDERGRFFGAVAPGMAALLAVPSEVERLTVFSSVELTAPVGMWHAAWRVTMPAVDTTTTTTKTKTKPNANANANAVPSGLIVRSWRWSARECGTGPYFHIKVATKDEIEDLLADHENIGWLVPMREEGQAWLDAHRARVVEVITTPARRPPGDITDLILR